MRDVMRRMSKGKNGEVRRPATYTMEDGTVVDVPAKGPFPVGQLLPRHKGVWGEVSPLCGCAECLAAGFTPAERQAAAEAVYQATQAKALAQHSKKAVAKRRARKAEVKTVLRRRAVQPA